MTLRIDEAERIAAAERNRVRQGEEAIAALKWLSDCTMAADFRIDCRWGSAVPGHKEAIAYLNKVLGEGLGELLKEAHRRAQRDMDYHLGKSTNV